MKLDFLHPREKFLILEILPHGANGGAAANGLFLTVDEDRNLVFEKFTKNVDLRKLVGSPGRRIAEKRWEGKNIFDSRRRVIAIADPAVATTIPVPVELDRSGNQEKGKMTIIELEDSIAREMKRIFNGCRAEAAKRLGLEDLSTVLVGSKVEHLAESRDSKGARDGKKVSFLLELTFTSREIFESLKDFFSASDGFFFAESPQVHLRMLAGVRPMPVHLLMENGRMEKGNREMENGRGEGSKSGEGESKNRERGGLSLFIFQKPTQKAAQKSAVAQAQGRGDAYPVLYRETLDWDFGTLFSEISAEFKVSREVAEELYHAYTKGKMSEQALRHFKKLLEPAVERFMKEVDRAKISGTVYVDAPFALPFSLPHKHGAAAFEHLPIEEVLQKFDFEVDAHKVSAASLPLGAISRYLAPFLEAYFDRSNSEINQKLRRRLHWLAE